MEKISCPRPGKPLFQYRLMQQSMPITHSAWTGWEGPDPSQWVPQGYVVVNLDLRGFGNSQGTSSLLSEQEGEDYHDAIQWVAQQPWSTGKVGLNGVSYLALAQWRAAATRPLRLRQSVRGKGSRISIGIWPAPVAFRRMVFLSSGRRA